MFTQTLQFVFDTAAATEHLHRMLSPGGVLLATMPSISRMDRGLQHSEYWRFTVPSCRRLFGSCFGAEQVSVRAYGNVLTAIGFLAGMAREELSKRELAQHDRLFPLIVAVRAVKRTTGSPEQPLHDRTT